MNKLALLSLTVACAGFASADSSWWGPNVGVFYPSHRSIKDAFGSGWVSYGIGPTEYQVKKGLSGTSDLNFFSKSGRGNRAFIIVPSFGVAQSFGDPRTHKTVPFVALRVGPTYADYSITRNGVYVSKKRFGTNANLEVGAVLNERTKISVRYDWMSKLDQFAFDGASLNVTFKLFKL